MNSLIFNLKLLIILISLFSFNAFSIESYNFSLIFGTSNLHKMGEEQTHGSGITLRSELFEDEYWGYLATAGVSQTESDTMISGSNEFVYNSKILQAGSFYYFAKYFRVAGGISYFHIDEEQSTSFGNDNFKYHKFGPFIEVGAKYDFGNFAFGIDYIAHYVDNFKQSGIFLLIGIGV